MLLDLAQESDGLHSSPVKTEDEPPSNGDESNQPVLAGWEVEREWRLHPGLFEQNAHEAHYVRAGRFAGKRLGGRQLEDVTGRADRHFGFERELAKEFPAQPGLADRFADHKRSRRTDVHYAEFSYLPCQQAGTKSPVPAHVDTL